MAENEAKVETKKEKTTINLNIWFIIFVVYLIFSLAYCFSLIQENKSLSEALVKKDYEISDMQYSNQVNNDRLISSIDSVIATLKEARQELKGVADDETTNVSIGTYTGSSDELNVNLTLSENNIASLSIVNNAGTSSYNGTYALDNGSIVFTAEDGLTTYSFVVNSDQTLNFVYNDVDVFLSK